jgi:hypothetical protein
MVAKQQRSKVYFGEPKAHHGLGEYFHVDIIVMTVPTIHGELYGIIFTDEKSRYRFGQLKKSTANLHGAIETLRMFLLTQRKIILKKIRCDQQFITKATKQLCKANGILTEASPPHEKNYNAISERSNKTVENMTLAMVKGAKLPLGFWGYSFTQAIYIINRLPTRALEGHSAPYKVCHNGEIPTLRFIRVFGCYAMKHVNKEARGGKMNDKAEPCVHLGYNILADLRQSHVSCQTS